MFYFEILACLSFPLTIYHLEIYHKAIFWSLILMKVL